MSADFWLAEGDFPFKVELLDYDTRRVLWEHDVTGPGPLRVPSRTALGVRAVTVRATWPDGTITLTEPGNVPGA